MAPHTRVTIRQVAAASGVSVSTVSNLLNGRTGAMAAGTRLRIERAVRELGYRPSSIARSLASKRTSTIGLVIDEIDTELFVSAIGAIEPLARRSGYSLIVTHRLGDDDAGPIDLLLEKEVDAVAFLSTSVYRDDAPMRRLRQRGMPTVLINRPQLEPIVSRVAWDNRGGARAAVEHLHRLGHRRIGHLRGPLDRESTVERLRGYRQGLAAHDIPYQPEYVRPGDYTAPAGETVSSVARLLDLRPAPTAIVAADDMIAAVAIQAAAARRLRVPDDLAVVGIDDQRLASFLVPPLTTVRLPLAEAGARALELLLERIADPDLEPEEVVMPTRLVVRQSCGSSAAG